MSDLNDRAGEEWESLRLMSFHGAPWDSADPPKSWLADMTREHVAKVADLINELASELRAAEARVAALTQENERLRYAVEYALSYDFTNAAGFYDVERVLKAAEARKLAVALIGEPEARTDDYGR